MAAPRSARSRPRRPGTILVPIGICGIALALRAIALDRDQLWFDEAYSALVALSSPTDIVSEAARDSSPPLYYLLLHGWAMAFGSASRALRSLSVVFGVATVLVTGMLGRQLWGAAAGTLGMMLLAVSPLHIYYSREVRAYALLALLAVLSVIALERLIQRGTRTSVLFYSGVVVAACYTHNYGLLLPVALLISLVQGRLPWTRGLVCLAIIAAAYAPWLPVLVRQVGSGATGWIAPWWHATPPALALARSFAVFCFGGARPPYLTLGSGGLPPIAVFASYLTFALVLGRSLMRPSPEAGRRMAVMCVLLLAVPVAVSFVAPVYLVGRHDVFALPFFLLLSARGTELLQTPIRWVCLVTMIVLGGVSTAAYYARPPVTGDAERAIFLAQTARPGDLILCTAFTRNALEYYARASGAALRFFSFPSSLDDHRGWVDDKPLADPRSVQSDAAAVTGRLAGLAGQDDRIWIAHSREMPGATGILMDEVERRMRQVPCPSSGETRGFTCWQRRR